MSDRHVYRLCLVLSLLTGLLTPLAALAFPAELFGYQQHLQAGTPVFGRWLEALERHLLEDRPEGDCSDNSFNRCHLQQWHQFLASLRGLERSRQLDAVNDYANRKNYILDIDNYGVNDYWAIAREFLHFGGDCEDYALTKLFSLRWLDFPADQLRLVVLQDTNLRVPHAVLAVADQNDILILDNQTEEVVSHSDIIHYTPVYSINEQHWWIHIPR